jgi:hypothetical protein
MIKEGEVMDKNEKKKSEDGFDAEAEKGYHGTQVASVVAKMLGAEGSDLGYPENFCLVEESSICKILDRAKALGIIKNIQFISTGGNSKFANFPERIQSFKQVETLLKCNIFYQDKYLIITDNLNEKEGKNRNLVDLFEKLEKLNKPENEPRFFKLNKICLENYYPNLCEQTKAEFDNEIQGKNWQEQGTIKVEFAQKIAEKIQSKEHFQKLFGNELNFLLKE